MENVIKNVKTNVNSRFAFIILKYCLIFAGMYCLSLANVSGVFPFWFGLFVALVVIKENIFIVTPLFIAAFCLSTLSLDGLIIASNMAAVIVIAGLIHKQIGKKITLALAGTYSLLGNIAFLYFNMSNAETALSAGISVIVGLIFCFCCVVTLSVIKNRNYAFKLNIDEGLCFAGVIIAIFCGLSYFNFWGFELAKFIAVFLLLVTSFIIPQYSAVMGIASGLGVALFGSSVGFVGCFAMMGVLAGVFKRDNRFFAIVAIIVVDVLFGLYFSAFKYGILSAVSTLSACLIYICLPNSILDRLNKYFNFVQNTAVKNIYNEK